MASRRTNGPEPKGRKRPPATTPEIKENQMIALAVDLAEKQLKEGTASAQVISHYVRLGSSREKLEQERLRRENDVLIAKVDLMASAKKTEEMYKTALDAMRSYAGHEPLPDSEPFDD
jgi:hypothetical protein